MNRTAYILTVLLITDGFSLSGVTIIKPSADFRRPGAEAYEVRLLPKL